MRARRKAVSACTRAAVSSAVCARLLARDDVRAAVAAKDPIAVYLASPDEIDLTDFIRTALSQGAALVAPRWNGEAYELAPLSSLDDLVAGPHGILEPNVLAQGHGNTGSGPEASKPQCLCVKVWLVPGLAFTKDGGRLGYGGGWYDRFLTKADEKAAKIGVAYGFQLVDGLPSEPHDVRVTEVLAEDTASLTISPF